MGSRLPNTAIAEYEQRMRTLTGLIQSAIVEARLVRRTVEIVDEARRSVTAQLSGPHRPRHRLDLSHADRVF